MTSEIRKRYITLPISDIINILIHKIEGVKMREYIGLFYFSGTGNTRIIANIIQKQLQLKYAVVDIISIEELINQNKEIDIEKYDMIGIGYPIYGFGEPRIIGKFVHTIPKVRNKPVFIFKTAADFISINHNSSRYRRKLHKKGYNVFYDRIICMGSNFFVKYNDELVKQLYLCAIQKAENICTEVLSCKKRIYKTRLTLRLFTSTVHWCEDNCFARIFGRSLKVSDECSQCGKCISNCPARNIYNKNNKIRFKWNCFLCMRCVYNCPKNAITSRGFNFVILKDGYDLKEIIQNPGIKGEYVTKDTKGFMKHFNSYLNDLSI